MQESSKTNPRANWSAYPRPQLVREDWLCLNGSWELLQGKNRSQIQVPFCPESERSGVRFRVAYGPALIYRRSFSLPEAWQGRRVLLHFGAVNQRAEILFNGRLLCTHDNGYLPFTVDLTGALQPGENQLEVCACNDLSHDHPWGKQKKHPGGMWYTPCSGIWQTVWLEAVPEQYIRALTIETGLDWVELHTQGAEQGTITLLGRDYPLENGSARIRIQDPLLWTPEQPNLYPFTLTCGADRVHSYFALRTLSVQEVGGIQRLCLNGKPYFFHGLLDQGYWAGGLYTPDSPADFERDILAMKELGFNTLRKHIKVEPEQFYYACDRLGMVVFQDMVNCGRYSFLRDTALPTLGVQKLNDRQINRRSTARQSFLAAMEGTVRTLRNHPCICLWTIFNEGWGQFCADEAYDVLRALDKSRFIDATSGWFHQTKSDVDSLHIYFKPLRLGKEQKPQLLSEFGGYVWKVPGHSPKKTYGYRILQSRESLVHALRTLYEKEVLPLAEWGLCGAIYTQVSDVQDETNGILTFDRAVQKIRPEEFADFGRRLQAAIEKRSEEQV